jgi:hypothetical protein
MPNGWFQVSRKGKRSHVLGAAPFVPYSAARPVGAGMSPPWANSGQGQNQQHKVWKCKGPGGCSYGWNNFKDTCCTNCHASWDWSKRPTGGQKPDHQAAAPWHQPGGGKPVGAGDPAGTQAGPAAPPKTAAAQQKEIDTLEGILGAEHQAVKDAKQTRDELRVETARAKARDTPVAKQLQFKLVQISRLQVKIDKVQANQDWIKKQREVLDTQQKEAEQRGTALKLELDGLETEQQSLLGQMAREPTEADDMEDDPPSGADNLRERLLACSAPGGASKEVLDLIVQFQALQKTLFTTLEGMEAEHSEGLIPTPAAEQKPEPNSGAGEETPTATTLGGASLAGEGNRTKSRSRSPTTRGKTGGPVDPKKQKKGDEGKDGGDKTDDV